MSLETDFQVKLYGPNESTGRPSYVTMKQNRDYSTSIEILGIPNRELLLSTSLDFILNSSYRRNDRTAQFSINYNNKLYNFMLQFMSVSDLDSFIDTLIKYQYMSSTHVQLRKEDIDEIERYKEIICDDYDVMELDDEQQFGNTMGGKKSQGDGGKNTLLRTSQPLKTAFVLRRYQDSMDIGAFDMDDDCKYLDSIKGIKYNNKSVMIDDMLLSDTRAVFRGNSDIYDFDLNKGKIISPIEPYDSNNVRIPVTGFIDNSAEGSTFLAFNNHDSILFDKRVEKPVVNKSAYKTDNKFSAGYLSSSGHLAMGSEKGIVRLYKGPCLTRATINFTIDVKPEDITGIEISPDDEWVLVTSPNFISVIETRAKSTQKLAFDSKMGTDKPPLIRLTLNQKDQATIAKKCGGQLPPFKNAHFDMKNGRIFSIVASVGPALISWDMRPIVNRKRARYNITFIEEESVNDDKVSNTTNDVIYIADNQVASVTRK